MEQYRSGQQVELTTQVEHTEAFGLVTRYYDEPAGLACEGFQTVTLTALEAEILNNGGYFVRNQE